MTVDIKREDLQRLKPKELLSLLEFVQILKDHPNMITEAVAFEMGKAAARGRQTND